MKKYGVTFVTNALCITLVFLRLCTWSASAHAEELVLSEVIKRAYYDPIKTSELALKQLDDARKQGDKAQQLRALQILYEAYGASEQGSAHPEGINEGLALAKELGNQDAEVDFLMHKSWTLWNSNQREQAKNMLGQAQTIVETNHLKSRSGWVYVNQGQMFNAAGLSPQFVEAVSKGFATFKEQGDSFGMAYALFLFGSTHRGTVDEDKLAEDYYNRAVQMIDMDQYRSLAAVLYLGLGKTYDDKNDNGRKDYAKAKQYYAAAEEVYRAQNIPFGAAYPEMYLGTLELQAKNYQLALERFNRALPLLKLRNNGLQNYALCLLGKARALSHLGHAGESLAVLLEADQVRKGINSAKLDVAYFRDASGIYAQSGDFAKAYDDMVLLSTAEKAAAQATNDKATNQLKAQFDAKINAADNALLKGQLEQEHSRNLIAVLSSALVLLLLFVAIFILRKRSAQSLKEAQFHQALAIAETSANRAKSAFLARMSHELRTPLNSIIGFARLLMREPSNSAQGKENLQTILYSGEHLRTLIDEVLDLSRIEAGRIVLNERATELIHLLEEIEEMFALSAAEKGVHLNVVCDPLLPLYIRTDVVRLRQILINLLGNAIKFTHSGSVDLIVGLTRPRGEEAGQEDDFCTLKFEVIDTGVGIASDELAGIGVPFAQAHAGQQAMEGAGLGLAISRSFIELMGGTFTIESEIGRGTKIGFTITVALAQPEDVIAMPGQSVELIQHLVPDQPHQRILIADDLEAGRRLMVQMIAPLGFETRVAANGAEAVAQWLEWKPDLICMDLRMPVMDGLEAVRRIRALPGGADVPIIMVTASSSGHELQSASEYGFNDYLVKPINESALFGLFEKHLNLTLLDEDRERLWVDEPEPARAIPSNLIAQLQKALAGLDVTAITAVITQIGNYNPAYADTLRSLARNYRYKEMAALLAARDR